MTLHEFVTFRATLDAEMKRLQSKGIGSKKRQAEAITIDKEASLGKGFTYSDSNPSTLLDTMVFYNGLYFALRS